MVLVSQPSARIKRVARWWFKGLRTGLALALAATLAIGIAIYRYAEGRLWSDAFLNAAMLLGGMGPVNCISGIGGGCARTPCCITCYTNSTWRASTNPAIKRNMSMARIRGMTGAGVHREQLIDGG